MFGKRSLNILLAILLISTIAPAQQQDKLAEWKESQAYTLGTQAYTFCFPWVFLSKLQFAWVAMPHQPGSTGPNMAMNQFWHARKNTTSDYRDGGTPNNDTYYSIAWLDVSKEPIILSHGDMGTRYFTFELGSYTSDNFAYVGSRTTGQKAGQFAIVGRNWKGTLPKGVIQLPASPTDNVLIFGRTAVKGVEDGPAANKLQDTYKLTPLSQWGKSPVVVPEDRKIPPPFNPKTDSLADWKTINRAMVKNPPLPQHKPLMDMFAKIGIGPGLNVDALDEATKRGLARAARDGYRNLVSMMETGLGEPKENGWSFPPKTMGRAMINNDFKTLALQCLGGILSHDPEEAIYINSYTDGAGQLLFGEHRYELRFEAGQIPEVSYFWSLTLYDSTNNLVKNPIDRWSIGSLGGGYKIAPDGSLTLHVQKESPGADKASNWLPSADGKFYLVFRIYGPAKKIMDRTWKMPPLKKMD